MINSHFNVLSNSTGPLVLGSGVSTELPASRAGAVSPQSSVDSFESLNSASAIGAPAAISKRESPKKVAVFYRWGPKKDISALVRAGGLTPQNSKPFVENDINLKGDGIYLAETPLTAQMYGDTVAEVWVDQELIDDGHFERFGGIIGGDWWLGQIDDILEEKGINLSRLDDPQYTSRPEVQSVFSEIGVYYRPFEGGQMPRGEMEKLIKYSEPEKRDFFREILQNRTYLWSEASDGSLSAIEYTPGGFEVGPLESKYCTQANRRRFKPYPGESRGSASLSSAYNDVQPYGFENDLKALSHKGFLHRAWEAYKDFKTMISNWFRG